MVLDIAPTLWMYEHTDMTFVRVVSVSTLLHLVNVVVGEAEAGVGERVLALVFPHPRCSRTGTCPWLNSIGRKGQLTRVGGCRKR